MASRSSATRIQHAGLLQCEVHVPPPPRHVVEQDLGLHFVKPTFLDSAKAQGKRKADSKGFFWQDAHRLAASDAFYISMAEIQDTSRELLIAAITPSPSGSTSQLPCHPSESAPSSSPPKTPLKQRDADNSPPAVDRPPVPPHHPAPDNMMAQQHAQQSAPPRSSPPLFFQDHSDEDDSRLINATRSPRQNSVRKPISSPERTIHHRTIKIERPFMSPSRHESMAPLHDLSSHSPSSFPSTSVASTSTRQHLTQPVLSSRASKNSVAFSTQPKNRCTNPQTSERRASPSARRRKAVASQSEPRKRKKGIESDGTEDEEDDDVGNLASQINEDALVRSTAPRHKAHFRKELAAFKKARQEARLRQKAIEISSDEGDPNHSNSDEPVRRTSKRNRRNDSDSDGSASDVSTGTSDADSSSGSDSGSSREFIVEDGMVEYDAGYRGKERTRSSVDGDRSKRSKKKRKKGSGREPEARHATVDEFGRIRLLPISQGRAQGGSVLAQYGLFSAQKKDIDDMCIDWLEWGVVRVLLSWTSLSAPDRERLDKNRDALKARLRSSEESVGSVAMRRQFKWYLVQYPKIRVVPLFLDKITRYGSLAKAGCGACHRKSQVPSHLIRLEGKRYNQDTLAPLESRSSKQQQQQQQRRRRRRDASTSSSTTSESDDASSTESDTESDRSDVDETWCEPAEDKRGRAAWQFYTGSACASRAEVMHQLHHWEWTTMQTLGRHPAISQVRREMEDNQGRGKDGREGPGAIEVAFCVGEMIDPTPEVSGYGISELRRLQRRVKTLLTQAVEINRAR
ncbi:hypothetical protein BCV70DRAFT_199576 [Testicularia cyperi]|uniref:DUF4211 domain-containing protein n=1 Tax=Testicularia cyperi TaxID=1882483 RepID=A0A317XV13_9BASI|nr:hypothetical protein BCV70DRAFT_199576 [Testicularia cyperi]